MAKTTVHTRATLVDDAAIDAAIDDLMRAFDKDTPYDGQEERTRENVRTLLTAIRERRGVVAWYDYEEASWGWPESVRRMRRNERHPGSRVGIAVALRTAEGVHMIQTSNVDVFGVTVISAPEDAVIDRFVVQR